MRLRDLLGLLPWNGKKKHRPDKEHENDRDADPIIGMMGPSKPAIVTPDGNVKCPVCETCFSVPSKIMEKDSESHSFFDCRKCKTQLRL